MNRDRMVASVFLAFVALALLPKGASAQSAIAGVVRDPSGGVLPGVTIEATSDALIEKSRSVTTDGQGLYRVVDLRPGVYVVTFTLAGFQTVKREGINLPSNFTATINTEMKVGSLEESITVSGDAPTVDVQSTATSRALSRELLDAIPTGRTIQGMGQLVVGVSLSSPDVGGARAMQQTYMSAHGMGPSQTTVLVDGLMVNGIDVDGAVQNYFSSANSQEMVYQTGGAGADASGGGVRMNMIPKDGGNRFSGSAFGGYESDDLQSDNLSTRLQTRGLRAPSKIDTIYNVEGAFGGPILKDKLWFYASTRRYRVDLPVADVFNADGSQGIDDNVLKNAMARLTWQISPRNKFGVYMERISKFRGRAMSAGFDPVTASIRWGSPNYTTGAAKLTSTVTSRLLIESGFSTNYERYTNEYQPGIAKEPGTPEWFATTAHIDLATGRRWNAGANEAGLSPDRFAATGSVSYVTGSHNIKVGVQDTFGRYNQTRSANGDLRQLYQNGAPFAVDILNTPLRFEDDLTADVGVYGQDSWRIKRLTLNGGLRWEYFKSKTAREVAPGGRFTQTREFGPIPTPIWRTFSPRFGAVYDLFGNGKTAIKFGLSKYQQQGTTGLANTYNPLALQTARVSWNDLNKDDIAQDNELNLAQLPRNFGVTNLSFLDPNTKRMHNNEISLGIQHEVLPRVSAGFTWYHRVFHNLRVRENTLQTFADFTPQDIVSPLDGSVIRISNVSLAKRNQVNLVDRTASSDRRFWYNGFETNFSARLAGGATVFGGTMTERTLAVVCDEPSNPFFLLYCDQRDSGIPWRTQLKVSGTYPLPWWGIRLSGALQSLPGLLVGNNALYTLAGPASGPGNVTTAAPNGAGTVWLITPTTRYAANCKGPCTPGALVNPGQTVASLSVPLVAPGTEFLDRINQLDVSGAKSFKVNRFEIQPKVDVFNLLNRSSIIDVRSQNFGTSSYLQPSATLQGRIVQISVAAKW